MGHGEVARRPAPEESVPSGFKELAQEGLRVGRRASEVAQLTADRIDKIAAELKETNRLLEEIRIALTRKDGLDAVE